MLDFGILQVTSFYGMYYSFFITIYLNRVSLTFFPALFKWRLNEWVTLEELDLDSVITEVDEKVEDKVLFVMHSCEESGAIITLLLFWFWCMW